MAERASALSGHYQRGNFGKGGEAGVILSEVSGLVLHQLSAWPDTLDQVGFTGAQACVIDKAPGPGRAAVGSVARCFESNHLNGGVMAANYQNWRRKMALPSTCLTQEPTCGFGGKQHRLA